MRNFKRFFSLFLSLFLLTIIIVVCVSFKRKLVILNSTDSMPHGFYYLVHNDRLQRGDVVCFSVPPNVEMLVKSRKWLPPGGVLMKRVIGLPGDFACVDGTKFSLRSPVDSVPFTGTVLKRDSLGRKMPTINFCDILAANTYFVAYPEEQLSFDSRYFGPIPKSLIMGVVRPLWKF